MLYWFIILNAFKLKRSSPVIRFRLKDNLMCQVQNLVIFRANWMNRTL